MEHQPFIGIGQNPDGPDLPIGLGMRLAQEPRAMDTFGRMSNGQKQALIHYIQSAKETGVDVEQRMAEVVTSLRDGRTAF